MENKESKKVSMATRSYIAGFFEGEGHIAIMGTNPVIVLSQRNPKILKWIQSRLDVGSLRGKQGPQRNCYQLRIQKKEDKLKFIRSIFPYCKVLKEELRIVIQLCQLTGKRGRPKGKSAKELLERFELRAKLCKELKKEKIRRRLLLEQEGD